MKQFVVDDSNGLVVENDALRDAKEVLKEGYADILIVDQEHLESEQREELVRLGTIGDIEIETVRGSGTLLALGGSGCLLRYRPSSLPLQPEYREGHVKTWWQR